MEQMERLKESQHSQINRDLEKLEKLAVVEGTVGSSPKREIRIRNCDARARFGEGHRRKE